MQDQRHDDSLRRSSTRVIAPTYGGGAEKEEGREGERVCPQEREREERERDEREKREREKRETRRRTRKELTKKTHYVIWIILAVLWKHRD